MRIADIFKWKIPNNEMINHLSSRIDKLYDILGIPEDGDKKSNINLNKIFIRIDQNEKEMAKIKSEIVSLKSRINLLIEETSNGTKNTNEKKLINNEAANGSLIEDLYFKQTGKDENNSLKKSEKSCYMEPSINGEFSANAKLRDANENDRDAFYVILPSSNNDIAEFYPVGNKAERLLMSRSDILDPVCNVQSSTSGGKLSIVSNGKLKKDGTKWVVVDKCIIKFS